MLATYHEYSPLSQIQDPLHIDTFQLLSVGSLSNSAVDKTTDNFHEYPLLYALLITSLRRLTNLKDIVTFLFNPLAQCHVQG